MRKPRRVRSALVAAGLAVLAVPGLVACGDGGPRGSITDADPTGTVELWTRSTLSSWMQTVVDDFNRSHPGLKVVMTPINDGNLVTKLATTLRTDNVPDLVAVDPGQAVDYAESGNFLDITQQLDASPLKDVLSKPQLAQAEVDGRYYGTPAALDASVLLYNKSLFAKAGIAGPPTTVAEMLDDARRIHALGPGIYGLSFAGNCAGCLAFTALPNFWVDQPMITGDDLDAQKADVSDNDALRTVLETYRAAWTEGLSPASDRAENGSLWNQDFQKGNIGLAPAGLGTYASATPDQQKNIGIAPLPTVDGQASTYIGGGNFGITAKAKNPAGAWAFIQFALSRTEQELLPKSGFSPVLSDLVDDPGFAQQYPSVVPGLKAAPTGFSLDTLYQAAVFNDSAGPWLALFQEAVFDGHLDRALADAQKSVQSILDGDGP